MGDPSAPEIEEPTADAVADSERSPRCVKYIAAAVMLLGAGLGAAVPLYGAIHSSGPVHWTPSQGLGLPGREEIADALGALAPWTSIEGASGEGASGGTSPRAARALGRHEPSGGTSPRAASHSAAGHAPASYPAAPVNRAAPSLSYVLVGRTLPPPPGTTFPRYHPDRRWHTSVHPRAADAGGSSPGSGRFAPARTLLADLAGADAAPAPAANWTVPRDPSTPAAESAAPPDAKPGNPKSAQDASCNSLAAQLRDSRTRSAQLRAAGCSAPANEPGAGQLAPNPNNSTIIKKKHLVGSPSSSGNQSSAESQSSGGNQSSSGGSQSPDSSKSSETPQPSDRKQPTDKSPTTDTGGSSGSTGSSGSGG